MQRHVIYCLAWGDGPKRGRWLYSRGQIKILCDEKCEFDARQQQIPGFASSSELTIFLPWLKLVAYVRVALVPSRLLFLWVKSQN